MNVKLKRRKWVDYLDRMGTTRMAKWVKDGKPGNIRFPSRPLKGHKVGHQVRKRLELI